jgi:hypothetical protein
MQFNVGYVKKVIQTVYLHQMLVLGNVKMKTMFVIHGFTVLVKNFCLHFEILFPSFLSIAGDVGVQRDCMSLASPVYSLIKAAISDKNAGCIKRIRGLDCFTFCSTDLCN